MKALITILLWLLLAGAAMAQGPVQSINTNLGISCNAIGSQGAVTKCLPGWTYGCSGSTSGNNILGTDGNRTSILFQDTGSIPIVLAFGDNAVSSNGFVVQPGNSFLWSNLNQGNTPGRVNTTPISIYSNGASTCVFMFTD